MYGTAYNLHVQNKDNTIESNISKQKRNRTDAWNEQHSTYVAHFYKKIVTMTKFLS